MRMACALRVCACVMYLVVQADFVTLRPGAALSLTYKAGAVSPTPSTSPAALAASATRTKTSTAVRSGLLTYPSLLCLLHVLEPPP